MPLDFSYGSVIHVAVSDVRYSLRKPTFCLCSWSVAWPHAEVFGSIDTGDDAYTAARNSRDHSGLPTQQSDIARIEDECCEAVWMRAQSPIATAPSATTDGRITELHLWAVREGLRRAPAATLFEDFCRRLAAAGVSLWRAFVGMRTLHPQWAGYTYTWWRDRDLVHPVRRERGEEYDQDLRDSRFLYLLNAAGTRDLPLRLRRRLVGGGAHR
jgi:hypothetical protein